MFKKLISALPFSPSLAGQLGFYLKRLKQEELTRRVGLVFLALALVVQALVVFAPPTAEAAASDNDVIYGGFDDKADLLRIYDKGVDSAGRKDIQQIYSHFGITREDIKNAHLDRINSKDHDGNIYSVGRNPYNKKGSDESAQKIEGTKTTVYMRKLRSFDAGNQLSTGNGYAALVGKRSVDGGWFAIVLACGNVDVLKLPKKPETPKPAPKPSPTIPSKPVTPVTPVTPTTPVPTPTPPVTTTTTVETCLYTSTLSANDTECRACENDSTIWYKDEKCKPNFVTKKTVANLTTALTDANNSTAKSGDKLEYTLSVTNNGSSTGTYTITDNISDISEYTDLLDVDGGTLSAAGAESTTEGKDMISWATATLTPGQSVQHKVIAQVKATLQATPQNISNPESYNCVLTNSFGDITTVKVSCPAEKVVEQTVESLPSTGPTENLLFAAGVAFVAIYFYARSRQLGKEVRLIRRDFNAGTI